MIARRRGDRHRRSRSRARRTAVAVALVLAATGSFVAVRLLTHRASAPSGCVVTDGTEAFALDPAQAANAATIAGVAARENLSDHAVSIALAAALQESKLHNIAYGDRDSVGLFQQRPSQGWGTRRLLLDPQYATAAFYQRLLRVHAWASLPIATAAQAVQHSADGSAYADWDRPARLLAKALTGELPRALTCALPAPSRPALAVDSFLRPAFGSAALRPGISVKRGWAVAAGLIAQAEPLGLESVSFDGYRWTRSSGRWAPRADRVDQVDVTVVQRS